MKSKYQQYLKIVPAQDHAPKTSKFEGADSMKFKYQIIGPEGMAEIEINSGRYLPKTHKKLGKFVKAFDFPEISKRDLAQLASYGPMSMEDSEQFFPELIERVRFLNRLELDGMDVIYRPNGCCMRFHSPDKLSLPAYSKKKAGKIKRVRDCECGNSNCYVYSNHSFGYNVFQDYVNKALTSKRFVKKHLNLIWGSLFVMYDTIVSANSDA